MATLPSSDPNRFGPVHLLRRKSNAEIEAEEADRKERIRRDNASVLDWVIEEQQATNEQERAFARQSALRVERLTVRKQIESARHSASLWRGIALTLLAMLILMAIGNCTDSGRRWRNEYYREASGFER